MKFCSQCGSPVEHKIPAGDNLPRHVCTSCGTVHYANPKLVVGCVPEWNGRILLCKRGIEPRLGYWTVPAGFLENGETLQQAAARETREEALNDIEVGSLIAIVDVTQAHQVHVFFRARMLHERFGPTAESLEVRLVDLDDIPWDDLAFPSTEFALRRYLADRAAGEERHHFVELTGRFS
ncbi:MAG TPA: NUDIX hydrolase [Steroidobacteraceae bacterium]|nr:NUDIX hydrolase [Steroidobacteraceae bacterium]HRX88116.1 NUDIX hydrolase [Steroidobacteraceae bacterium]